MKLQKEQSVQVITKELDSEIIPDSFTTITRDNWNYNETYNKALYELLAL